MATPLPNAKLFSPHSLTALRSPFLHYLSRPSLTINGQNSITTSTISSLRQRQCIISFAFHRRNRTTSTSAPIFSENKKEDCDDEEEDEDEEEEEEEGGEYMPLREMARWLQNKPAGFGEGLRYDTAVEDKILEEMNRNKKDPIERNGKSRAGKKENAASVKKHEKPMVTEVIKSDPEVRVWNLPKKKNIDRDLRKAFEGFSGIISINPAVTGNKKTRDPICRGFAFIGFESDDAAYGFVQKYSNQNLLFGKVQKQISCDLVNVHGDLNSSQSSKSSSTLEYRRANNEFSISNASETYMTTNGTEPNKEEFPVLSNGPSISSSNNENEGDEDLQFINSSIPAYQNRKKISKRGERKPPKSSKGHTLRSLAKLKIKDRAVLTGVFSKYGEVASAATKKV